jgi:DNA excision repair protein ERCC-3
MTDGDGEDDVVADDPPDGGGQEATAADAATDTDGEPTGDGEPKFDKDEFYDALESAGRPLVTAGEVARHVDVSHAEATDLLAELPAANDVDVENDPVVWYPEDVTELTDRERVVVFPDRRRLVLDQPEQYTLARCSQFAHLVTTSGEGGYVYEIRDADVWAAPFDDLGGLLTTIRRVAGRWPTLEEFVRSQWERARKFRLRSGEDYTVLEAASDDLMGNVALEKLDEDLVRGLISDTEAWVVEGKASEIKRTLYDAGYPVRDDRELESGDALPVELNLDLRGYQRDWVDRFVAQGAGVLVGPPGSGKTVAAMGVMSEIEGETLVLVPSRELARQWREQLVEKTTLEPDQVGEYHGGTKELRPVTVATYQTAGMDRHRKLFDARRWGLVVYDECQSIPSPVFRRSADLQSKHRLGLSGAPVREDDRESEIFTLVGPPIGTDWTALFEAGFVAEPEVEIRYVPWSEDAKDEYDATGGHERRQVAASNPAKVEEIERIAAANPDAKALVFVDYLDQGDAIAEKLDVPFVSGETRHAERARLFEEFRRGERELLVLSRVGDEGIDLPDAELAIVASGLGGSRRQGTQRAGRTMRPVGRAQMYVLATRGTEEEDFARQRMRHLSGKGVTIRETEAEPVDGEATSTDGQ